MVEIMETKCPICNSKYVDIWHTSCNLTKNELIKLGVLEKKIEVITLGADLNHFHSPSNNNEKKN